MRSRFLQRRVPFLLDTRAHLFRVKAKAGDVFAPSDRATDALLEPLSYCVHLFLVRQLAAFVKVKSLVVFDNLLPELGERLIRPPPFALLMDRPCLLAAKSMHLLDMGIQPVKNNESKLPNILVVSSDIPQCANH